MPEIAQHLTVSIRQSDILDFALSVPKWADLSRPLTNKGLVRHGGVTQVEDFVGPDLKPTYPRHVREYLSAVGDPEGRVPRALLVFGTRNTMQNVGLCGWHADRTPRLLRRVDEPWRSWVYHALVRFRDGSLAIEKVQFLSETGGEEPDEIRLESGRPSEEVLFAVSGQPILWEREVPPPSLLAACTYDLRHVYNLCWEESLRLDVAHVPRVPGTDKAIHDELMRQFMGLLHAPLAERAAALAAVAAREALPEADGYLHSSVGLSENGRMNLAMKTGSLTDLGRTQLALGSTRALLLDNGGSVGLAYWSKRAWVAEQWSEQTEHRPAPVVLGCGSYHRPKGHAVLIVQLKDDILEKPFVRRPRGDAAWR